MDRRTFLDFAMASGVAATLPWSAAGKPDDRFKMNAIPSSGESVPAVGLGYWITFNVGDDPVLLDSCAAVMEAFFRAAGNMIDSSPMYGSSQTTIGYGLEKLNRVGSVFCAEKVWTSDAREGRDQIDLSKTNWGASRLDLVQVHNLLAWRNHLPILQAMKESGEIRYIGITNSHGRRHDGLEEVMKNYPVDFVQLTYYPVDREAENRYIRQSVRKNTPPERSVHDYGDAPFARHRKQSLRPAAVIVSDPNDLQQIPDLIAARGGVDVCYAGVGITGHLAFNDPEPGRDDPEWMADLPTRVVRLLPETRLINSVTAAGGNTLRIPFQAITVGMREILAARRMRIWMNRDWQRAAIRRMLHGPVTGAYPASLVQNHPDVSIDATEIMLELP